MSIGVTLKSVMIAIDLDDELLRGTSEVREVGPDWVLTPELHAIHSMGAQELPDDLLGPSAGAPQVSCPISSFFSYDPPLLASPPAARAERNMNRSDATFTGM